MLRTPTLTLLVGLGLSLQYPFPSAMCMADPRNADQKLPGWPGLRTYQHFARLHVPTVHNDTISERDRTVYCDRRQWRILVVATLGGGYPRRTEDKVEIHSKTLGLSIPRPLFLT